MVRTPFRYETASPDRYELLKQFATENRKNQTQAERFLWESLRGEALGYDIRRQHIIGDYIADFVCLDASLIIEVDGGYHAEREQQENDAIRTKALSRLGFRIIRFTNEEILFDIDKVLEQIRQELQELTETE
ncbi:MAG: endonuclease domain-containing protein [Bacteroidaceae bacterium]|nr:endonuclease domain-containing protein [Bacteroidaceae bacterium]